MELESTGPSLTDLSEDTLSCVLSFLRPRDLSACARVCRRLRELCSEEGKVWPPMCERRWGSRTNLSRWGNGRIPYRLLYGTLARWENLIGFWRGVGNGGCGFLTLFEWAPHRIVGYKVVPAGLDNYGVRKIPFLWMGIFEDGQIMCFLDPAFKRLGKSDVEASSMMSVKSITSSSCQSMIYDNMTASLSCPAHIMDMDLKAFLDMGMLLVDVHFVGSHHLVIEEIVQQSGPAVNELAEAATLAAFGSSHNLAEISPLASGNGPYSNATSPYSSSSETENHVGSPPGSFQYEMYQFLVSKVTSAGGERAARKQRRRGKERAWSQGKCVLEPEHFVKVIHVSPTKARPLQGLWKGFFELVGLDFVLVSYDDKEGIVCRKVQDLAGTSKSGSVLWTSKTTTRVGMPLCLAEEGFYNSRTHIQPLCSLSKQDETSQVPFEFCEEVIGMLSTSSCDFQSLLASNKQEGRVWQYANGTFGFGYLHSSSIIDFRVLCLEGSLLDTIE